MPKINEQLIEDGDKIIHKKVYDTKGEIEQVKRIAEATDGGIVGENRLVGRIPAWLIGEWIKEAGIKWDDTGEIQEIIKKKMLSGEFDKFRVWKGRY